MLDRAPPVHDPEPKEAEVEAGAPGVQLDTKLGEDLGQVRKVALRAIWLVWADLTVQVVAVDVGGAGVDDRDVRRRRSSLRNAPGAGDVRLLGVVGIALGQRPAR